MNRRSAPAFIAFAWLTAVASGSGQTPASTAPAAEARLEGPLDRILASVHPETKKWATVIRVRGAEPGQPTRSGESTSAKLSFDTYHLRDSSDAIDFWPASTIKLYTAIAALEWLNAERLPLDSAIAFSRQTPDGAWVRDCARTVPEMISEVFRRSSNEDYTLLLRMLGIDRINTEFLIPAKGFPHSALMRDYVTYRPVVYENDEPQRIDVFLPDGKTKRYQHTWSGTSYAEQRGATVLSSKTGNCTSTAELADCLRRVVFHAAIPEQERFAITAEQAKWLLEGDPERGVIGLENRLAGAYGWQKSGEEVFPQARYFHKAGLISTYSLDVCYLADAESDTHLILALAAKSGDPAVIRAMAAAIYRAADSLR